MMQPTDRPRRRVPLFVSAEQRIRDLEDALEHTRQVADRERRRADLLERVAQEAYRRAAHSRVQCKRRPPAAR